MKKHEELKLSFYKKIDAFGEKVYILDTSNATNINKGLHFIDILNRTVIIDLIETITLIQNNQIYDPYFLENAEEFSVFNVIFSTPNFWIGGYQTIHMDDFKLLLQEWLVFRNL
ncbi:MAG TPA: hypothetical protein VIV55_00425 [Flavobacterium sp.]